MDFNDILDDNEKQALIQFNSLETMKQAVKKVLLAGLYENGTIQPGKPVTPTRNGAFYFVSSVVNAGNEEIGAELRALWQGVNALELAFNKIGEFVPEQKADPKPNQAR